MAHQHQQLHAASDAGVHLVPLQHRVVLGEQGDHHGGVFAALALVDRAGVGGHQVVESPQP